MAITYTFKTDNTMKLEIAPMLGDLENVVTRVRYNYVGVDENGNEGTFSGATPMPLPSDTENFKPFSELQPENIVAWLELVSDKAHMQERIAKQITDKITPKYVDIPLPWDPQPTGSIVETPTTGSIVETPTTGSVTGSL
jgi:hypothetical protein